MSINIGGFFSSIGNAINTGINYFSSMPWWAQLFCTLIILWIVIGIIAAIIRSFRGRE